MQIIKLGAGEGGQGVLNFPLPFPLIPVPCLFLLAPALPLCAFFDYTILYMTSHSFPYFSLFRPPWESCFPPPLSLLPIPTLFSPSYLLPCPPPPSETEKNEDVTFFTLPSGLGLVIPIFFRVFFCGHLPQTPSFRSVKQIIAVFRYKG